MEIDFKDIIEMWEAPKSALTPIDIFCWDSGMNLVRVPDAHWSKSRKDWWDNITRSTFTDLGYTPSFWVKTPVFAGDLLGMLYLKGNVNKYGMKIKHANT